MLEGLDAVAWGELSHAYGRATDVPGTIRALVAPDAGEREKALDALYGNIFHQGSRYQATAAAVPFVLELLADPATPGRPALARLLRCLAVGYDDQWLPDTFPVDDFRAAAAGAEGLLRAGPPPDDWAEDGEDADRLCAHFEVAAYDAVRAGVPLVRMLAGDDDPALRAAAACLLAWFPEEAAGSVPVLRQAAAAGAGPDDDPAGSAAAAASAVVALGMLGRATPPAPGAAPGPDSGAPPAAVAVDVASAAMTDDRDLVRWAAAVALVGLRGPEVSLEVVAELLTWAGSGDGGRDEVPFLDGDVAGLAARALRHLGELHGDVALDALLRRLRLVSGTPAVVVLDEALRRAWPDGGTVAAGTPCALLSGAQQRVVGALAESPAAWRLGTLPFGNFAWLLESRGLPGTHHDMRAYAQAARSVRLPTTPGRLRAR